MSDAIERYLEDLKRQLSGSDPATVQDATADAEEHLRSALEQAMSATPGTSEEEAVKGVIEQYGAPQDVAKSYRELENRFVPVFAVDGRPRARNPIQRFFGVLGDARAYAALIFMLFSLITGIVYFTWAVTGISLSMGLLVTILGLPFFGLFIFSVHGLGLVEGRLIEAMLGVRMPRRQASTPRGKGLWGRFVAALKDRRAWTTLFYLILKLPMGVFTFCVFITLLAYSLELIFIPVLQLIFDFPLFVIDDLRFEVPVFLMPILVAAGLIDLIVILHLARWFGKAYGAMAKAMLVKV